MAGFVKFDPYAFLKELEKEDQAAAANNGQNSVRNNQATKVPSVAGVASVAGVPSNFQNLDGGLCRNLKTEGTPATLATVATLQPADLKGHPSKNENIQPTPATLATPSSIDAAFAAFERHRPACIDQDRWRRAVEDGQQFLATWGSQAAALGWTAEELFGLHEPPSDPHPSYNRLSRYDCTGLISLLSGNPVVALTTDTAAIQHGSGSVTNYRKERKPGLGPLGDSLDDFI